MAKRGQGEGSISRRPDGTWWARITLGKNEDGKQKRKAFYGKTRKEVLDKLTAAVDETNQGIFIVPSAMTLGKWLDIWMNEYRRQILRPSTFQGNCDRIKVQIKPALGDVKLKDLRSDMIQTLANKILDDGLSTATAIQTVSVIKCALDQAVKNELVRKNVAKEVTLPKRVSGKREILTLEEQKRFIGLLQGDDIGEILLMILATGMRIGEVLVLTWDDVDFVQKTVTINKSLTHIEIHNGVATPKTGVGEPKTKSSFRKIPLLPATITMLQNRQDRQKRLIADCEPLYHDNNLVFGNNYGELRSSGYVTEWMKKLMKKHGFEKNMSVHDLRHTFASRGLESGVPLKVMQELLGHASIKMTADLYTHVLPELKNNEILKIQSTIDISTEAANE